MSLILLADDSPHAQRMGEHILREEGYEVLTAADGNSALARLAACDPGLIIADAFLPGRNGFALCRLIKRYRPHVRVILTAGSLEELDEPEAHRAGCDGILRKPFEASVAAQMIRSLMADSVRDRSPSAVAPIPVSDAPASAAHPPPDPARIHAAIEAALAEALPGLVRDITERVLVALGH